MPAGRPTLCTPELLEKARVYIEEYESVGDVMPSIAGLACYLDIRRETCHRWANEEGKEEFNDILRKILDKQERVLFNNGLKGDFNAAITKLALGKHGYHDTAKIDGTMATTEMTEEQVDAAIQRRLSEHSSPSS